MSSEKRVGDIMVPAEEYSRISSTCTFKQAVRVMYDSFYKTGNMSGTGHQSVLVYDEDNQLAGLITFRAIMEAVEPSFLKMSLTIPGFFEGIFSNKCTQEANRRITEIMIPIKEITIKKEDTLLKAIHLMLNNKLNSLPVVNHHNRVIGMVRNVEIFREIANTISTGSNDLAS